MNPIFAAFTAALLIWFLSASFGAVADNQHECRPDKPEKVCVIYQNGTRLILPRNQVKEGYRNER